ncbi:Maf family protein [Jannaschia sp. LMIT008]|uniref:Maf family protein n=1 Tax=Jannaschia maritima TaxID=3032585 RepID=UPI00281105E1|nr:Maf family protein [Jannaschia sp. LMIT008]
MDRVSPGLSHRLTLASASATRARLLEAAGIPVTIRPARLDEEAVKLSLSAEDASARDVADTLAEMKATKGAVPGLCLGCDQVLTHGHVLLSKPRDRSDAVTQLYGLRGKQHRLLSAAVIAEDGRPVWRHVAEVRMTMRPLSDAYVANYVERNWNEIRHAVGAYQLEAEGARLFDRVEGDYFAVLGLPLLQVIGFLADRGVVAT